jgi:hypothetical protein
MRQFGGFANVHSQIAPNLHGTRLAICSGFGASFDVGTIDSMARLFQSVAEAKIYSSASMATVLDFQRRRRGITS